MSNSLAHYGILGMHWGIRRYQNPEAKWSAIFDNFVGKEFICQKK